MTFHPSDLCRLQQSQTGLSSFLLWSAMVCLSCARTFETTSGPDAVLKSTERFASTEKEDIRAPMTRLMDSIQNLPVAKGKVPPLVADVAGQPKVVVNASVAILSVIAANDVQQSIKTVGIAHFQWQDDGLAWDPANFSGIDTVEFPGGVIWSPSFFIVNALEETNILSNQKGHLIKTSSPAHTLDSQNSENSMNFHSSKNSENQAFVSARCIFVVETLCDMNLNDYPFDQQTCPLSIVAGSKFVDLRVSLINGTSIATSHSVSAEWDILSTKGRLFTVEHYGEKGVMVVIEIKRKTTFYTLCLVLPMILTSYMNTLVFLLPFENGEKVSFVVTILVSTSVFVSFFTSVMPRGLDSVPSTMKLLIGVIVESFVILILTIIVVRSYDQQATRSSDRNSRLSDEQRDDTQRNSVDSRIRRTEYNKPSLFEFPLGTQISQECCSSKSRTSPDEEDAAQDPDRQASEETSRRQTGRVAKISNLSAEHLDNAFFLVSFIGNTLFLAVLLIHSRAT